MKISSLKRGSPRLGTEPICPTGSEITPHGQGRSVHCHMRIWTAGSPHGAPVIRVKTASSVTGRRGVKVVVVISTSPRTVFLRISASGHGAFSVCSTYRRSQNVGAIRFQIKHLGAAVCWRGSRSRGSVLGKDQNLTVLAAFYGNPPHGLPQHHELNAGV